LGKVSNDHLIISSLFIPKKYPNSNNNPQTCLPLHLFSISSTATVCKNHLVMRECGYGTKTWW